jgi:hypothetical protein
MKIIVGVFLIIFSFQSKADAVTKAAFNYGQKALFSYPIANKFRKDTEKYLLSFIPINKENIAIVGGVGFAIYSGSISTRNFKNLSVGVMGWNMFPELSLNTKTGKIFALISINKQF